MLWVIGILILILILMLTTLLVLPLRVEVDTEHEVFEAKWEGLFGIRLAVGEGRMRWFYRVFLYEKEWLQKAGGPAPEKPRRVKKPTVKKPKPPLSVRQMWKMLKSMPLAVDVKKLHVNWDTGDFVQNAWLYPAFRFMSGGNRRLRINFLGKQDVAILLQTRLYRVVWAFLRVIFSR